MLKRKKPHRLLSFLIYPGGERPVDYRTNRRRDEGGLLFQDRAVMNLLLLGKSRADICKELDMPLGTVNTCCTRIYRKTGCKNLPELIVKYGSG